MFASGMNNKNGKSLLAAIIAIAMVVCALAVVLPSDVSEGEVLALVDELVAYTAPCFFGEGLGPAAVPLPEAPGSARRWKFKSADFVGGDLRMICRRN